MTSIIFRLICLSCFIAVELCFLSTAEICAEEEGAAALFVIDSSPEFDSTGGECVAYSKDTKPGPSRSLLGIVKGHPGAVTIVAAFEMGKDKLSQDLPPILAEQTKDSNAMRFPSSELPPKWSFERPMEAELFVVIYAVDDPALVSVRKTIESIRSSTKPEAISLHSSTLRKHFTSMMRNQSVDVEVRIAPTSIAAVRRGLKKLGSEWKDDSLPINYSKGKPGILVFKIAG